MMARILIAEDERDILNLITFTLQYAGFDVIPTGNGEEALNMTRLELPDLVMLDVRMPRLTGYEVCRLLKSDELTKHIPVVFLSAKGQEAEVNTGLEAGAIEYLLKPFAPDQLIAKMHSILELDTSVEA
jgi:DNA-binding response OmpR family regulator